MKCCTISELILDVHGIFSFTTVCSFYGMETVTVTLLRRNLASSP